MKKQDEPEQGLVSAQECIKAIWSNPVSRPSLRWFKELKRSGIIPFIKVRRLVFYDPALVRQALAKHSRTNAEAGK